MCVIIVKDHDKMIDKMQLVRAEEINPDGLGIIWLDTGEVVHTESDDWRQLLTNRPYIAHFRLATVGAINRDNTHPYPIPGMGDAHCSDTRELSYRMSGMSKRKWGKYLSSFKTVRFLTYNEHTNKYRIHNKSMWSEIDGTWYSKTNILESVRLAVYGTLKYGGGNYYSYLWGASTHVGMGKTVDKYPMVVESIPYVVNAPGKGHNISVDVFTVSPDTLESIDGLEGHPDWYQRKKVDIKLNNGKTVSCWLYFNDVKGWENAAWHQSYDTYRSGYGYGYGYGYGSHRYDEYSSSYQSNKKGIYYNGWKYDVVEGLWVRDKEESGELYKEPYKVSQSTLYDNVFRIINTDNGDVEDIIEVNFDSGAYVSLANLELGEFGLSIGDILIDYGSVSAEEAVFMKSNGMADSRRKLKALDDNNDISTESFCEYTEGEKAIEEAEALLDSYDSEVE